MRKNRVELPLSHPVFFTKKQERDRYMNDDYTRISQAIEFLDRNFQRQPELEEIAAHVHLSSFHFQRLFKRWAGISPKRFLQYLTIEYARDLMEQTCSLLDVAYESGLSGPGRLHDLFVAVDAVTPGEYKNRGSGLKISYGLHDSPFGICLIAATERGICHLSFHDPEGQEAAVALFHQRWPGAEITFDPWATLPLNRQIFGKSSMSQLRLHLRGTNFQLKVWEALLRIPSGGVVSYQEIAKVIGQSGATRAVGTAVGRNPIAFLIPCHRVIRQTGAFGNYRWGLTRKKAIFTWEQGRKYSLIGDKNRPGIR